MISHRFYPQLMVTCLLILFAILWSCGKGPTKPGEQNDPPDTFITKKSLEKVPLETDSTGAFVNLTKFVYSIEYTGVDLDGKVDSFQVSINNGPWSSSTIKTSSSDTLDFDSESATNTVSVRSKDNQGAVDPEPASVVFTLGETGANAMPTTAFESGPSTAATTSSGVRFVVTGSDPDGQVVQFSYSLDGGAAQSVAADADGKAVIEFSESNGNLLAAGNHSISAQAIDNLGGMDETPETRSFFVSSGFSPIIEFQAGPADGGGWFSGVDVSFAFSAVLSHYDGALLGFSWAFDDSSEGAFTAFSTEGLATILGGNLTPGDHFFVLRAKDLAGVVSKALIRFTAASASLDQGIVLIDDCNFGENETLEAIFAAAGFPVSRYWDFDGDAANGHPQDDLSIWTPGELGKYSTVVFFTDNSPTAFNNSLLLGAYVKAGGNIWMTSYNWSGADPGFLSETAGIRRVFNDFECAGIRGVNAGWANPSGATINDIFDGITIDWIGSRGSVDILDPSQTAGEAIFEGTPPGNFPEWPRAVFMPHPDPWGKVVSWGHSLRQTASNDPALQAAVAIILGTFFGE